MRKSFSLKRIVYFFLISMLLMQLVFIKVSSEFKFIGDETVYLTEAWQDRDLPWTSLLPGNLIFSHRLPFVGRFFSRFAPSVSENERALTLPPQRWNLLLAKRVFYLNFVFFLIILSCTYLHARFCEIDKLSVALILLFLTSFPRFVSFVHYTLSDMMHLALQSLFVVFFIFFLRERKYLYLLLSTLMLGVAILCRATLLGAFPFVLSFLVVDLYFSNKNRGDGKLSFKPKLFLPPLIFIFVFSSVLGPQYYRNYKDGYGLRLSSNIWRNIEFALRAGVPGQKLGTYLTWREASDNYKSSSSNPVEREVLAQKRVMEYFRTNSLGEIFSRQVYKLQRIFINGDSSELSFAFSGKRWGELTNFLKQLASYDFVFCKWLTILSALGFFLAPWKNSIWNFTRVIIAYYAIAAFFFCVNSRVVMHNMIPMLAIFASIALQVCLLWIRRLLSLSLSK